MDNNTAYAYNLDENYTSIYVNLNGYDQIIFYWSLADNCQKRKPKWRASKETIQEGMEIVAYNNLGCTLVVNNRPAKFTWYEYDRDISKLRGPNHQGSLENFADWEFDPDFKNDSPTSQGIFSGDYDGNYSNPNYNKDLDPFYDNENKD